MKKYLKFLMLLPFVTLFAACDLGDSEPVGKYAFETDAQKILIEAKLPNGVYDADDIYICGPFNGAEPESYVADAKWRLTQSSININIFGVYLDPNDFVEGTSLGDGFWFYSANSGLSLTTKKELATYTSSAGLGQRTSVVVSQWGEPVKDEVETLPEHPGTIRVYVDNQAGWEAVALYQWGTENNLGGGWPGAQPTGTEVISEVEYIYFEYKVEDVDGKSQNLIFNNNGGGIQTADIPVTFSSDVVDHFFRIFNEKDWEAIDNPIKPVQKLPEHEGTIRVYADNQAGWEAVALYQWGTENNLGGGWPGQQPTGTEVISEVEYIYFEYKVEDVDGKSQNLIFNNNGGGIQTADIPVTFSSDVVDHFFRIFNEKDWEAIDNPIKPVQKLPEHEGTIRVYADNQAGWEAVALYQWGTENNLGGGWPGAQPTGTEIIADVEYTYFEYAIADVEGKTQNLIFNNNGGGTQTADMPVTFSAEVLDHFFVIFNDKDCEVIEDPFNRTTPGQTPEEPSEPETPEEPVNPEEPVDENE